VTGPLAAEAPPGARVCPGCLTTSWHPGGPLAGCGCGGETLPRDWDAYYDGRAGRALRRRLSGPEGSAEPDDPAAVASHAAGLAEGRRCRRD
jgi:hypothetical protein